MPALAAAGSIGDSGDAEPVVGRRPGSLAVASSSGSAFATAVGLGRPALSLPDAFSAASERAMTLGASGTRMRGSIPAPGDRGRRLASNDAAAELHSSDGAWP